MGTADYPYKTLESHTIFIYFVFLVTKIKQ